MGDDVETNDRPDPEAGKSPGRVSKAAELQVLIEVERGGEPFLVCRDADGLQQIWLLRRDESARRRLGRKRNADVSLAWDIEVSREHALFELVGDDWTVIDDGLSRNGSFVNGIRVIGRRRLDDGDRLCFGTTQIVYRDPGPHETEPTGREFERPGTDMITPTQRKVLVALCRPINDSPLGIAAAQRRINPATNVQIAGEVFLSVDAVKAHLRDLYVRFDLADLPQNEKRAQLAHAVLAAGVISPRDF